MKTYPPQDYDNYEGNKGCLVLIAAAGVTFFLFICLVGLFYLINLFIK
jgi:hypothetical protein